MDHGEGEPIDAGGMEGVNGGLSDLGEAGETCVGPALPLKVVGGIGALPCWPRLLEFTRELAGGRAPRLLRAVAPLVTVGRNLATLAPPPSSSSSSSSDPAAQSPAARAVLTFATVSVRSNSKSTDDQSSRSDSGGALGPVAER